MCRFRATAKEVGTSGRTVWGYSRCSPTTAACVSWCLEKLEWLTFDLWHVESMWCTVMSKTDSLFNSIMDFSVTHAGVRIKPWINQGYETFPPIIWDCFTFTKKRCHHSAPGVMLQLSNNSYKHVPSLVGRKRCWDRWRHSTSGFLSSLKSFQFLQFKTNINSHLVWRKTLQVSFNSRNCQ